MIFLIGQVGGEGLGEPVCLGSWNLKIDFFFPPSWINFFGGTKYLSRFWPSWTGQQKRPTSPGCSQPEEGCHGNVASWRKRQWPLEADLRSEAKVYVLVEWGSEGAGKTKLFAQCFVNVAVPVNANCRFWFRSSGWGLRVCTSDKFPGDACPGSTLSVTKSTVIFRTLRKGAKAHREGSNPTLFLSCSWLSWKKASAMASISRHPGDIFPCMVSVVMTL